MRVLCRSVRASVRASDRKPCTALLSVKLSYGIGRLIVHGLHASTMSSVQLSCLSENNSSVNVTTSGICSVAHRSHWKHTSAYFDSWPLTGLTTFVRSYLSSGSACPYQGSLELWSM